MKFNYLLLCIITSTSNLLGMNPTGNHCTQQIEVPVHTGARDQQSPLINAIFANNVDDVRRLLAAGAKTDTKHHGLYPLHFAVIVATPEIVSLLLDAQCDVNTIGDNGSTAIFAATVYNKIDTMRLLLEKSANPNIPTQGLASLDIACTDKNHESIKLLIAHGALTGAAIGVKAQPTKWYSDDDSDTE